MWQILHTCASAYSMGAITARQYGICLDTCADSLANICKHCHEHFLQGRGALKVQRHAVERTMYEFHAASRKDPTEKSPSLEVVNTQARIRVRRLLDSLPLGDLMVSVGEHMTGPTGLFHGAAAVGGDGASSVAMTLTTAQLSVADTLAASLNELGKSPRIAR